MFQLIHPEINLGSSWKVFFLQPSAGNYKWFSLIFCQHKSGLNQEHLGWCDVWNLGFDPTRLGCPWPFLWNAVPIIFLQELAAIWADMLLPEYLCCFSLWREVPQGKKWLAQNDWEDDGLAVSCVDMAGRDILQFTAGACDLARDVTKHIAGEHKPTFGAPWSRSNTSDLWSTRGHSES